MPSDLYYTVLAHLKNRNPDLELHSHITMAPSLSSKPLLPRATFFDHVIIEHKRYLASSRAVHEADALLAVRTSNNGSLWVGELCDIFMINQPAVGIHHFGRMRWFKPVIFDMSNTIWAQL
jgi:hypothetical protein